MHSLRNVRWTGAKATGHRTTVKAHPQSTCDMFMRLQIYIHSQQFHSLAEIGKF